MALCPIHHDQCTRNAVSEARQRAWQANPHNKRQGYVSGALLAGEQDCCALRAGGTLLVGEGPLIQADGRPLLSLRLGDDGDMLVSVELQDEAGEVLALIEDSEWISGDPSVFDLEAGYRRLTIRSAPRQIALDLNAGVVPALMRADLWVAGLLIRLSPNGLIVRGLPPLFEGITDRDASITDLGLVGLALNINTGDSTVTLHTMYDKACFVSHPDPMVRFSRSVNAWRQITVPAQP